MNSLIMIIIQINVHDLYTMIFRLTDKVELSETVFSCSQNDS